jgi:ribonuclease BN (tRNA processing enzyme)
MRLTVLGGCGAWPTAGQACSGYLVEHDGFLLLMDPGYATLPRLLQLRPARGIDAVLVSHGHADHCADLHPLLRARALGDDPPSALPVHSLPGAVDPVLALDPPSMLQGAFALREFQAGDRITIGPFQVDTWLLPHFVPNAGLRVTADGRCLAYTGDTGPSPELTRLARDADVFLAEATYPEQVPDHSAAYLSSAKQTGQNATRASVGQLVLTHLWPGTDPLAAVAAATRGYGGEITIASAGITVEL